MTDKIEAARAVLAALGVTAEELIPAGDVPTQATDIDAMLPRRRWVPEVGERYWYTKNSGAPGFWDWTGGKFDADQLNLGRVFSSFNAAQEYDANIRAWVELRERSDNVFGGWDVVGGDGNLIPGVGFSSRELRDAAVAHIGKDRIAKLIRWIWGA